MIAEQLGAVFDGNLQHAGEGDGLFDLPLIESAVISGFRSLASTKRENRALRSSSTSIHRHQKLFLKAKFAFGRRLTHPGENWQALTGTSASLKSTSGY